MTAYQHIYLSPHFDDVSLSCGGAIHRQAQAREPVLVVTVCAAPPATGVFSAYTAQMHQKWGNPADVIATRRAEDQASLAVLGADGAYLPVPDCIYRGNFETGEWYYTSDAALFGEVHPAEAPLVDKIVTAVIPLLPPAGRFTVYAPLGVGHHVDHQLTHRAAWQLYRRGHPVAFFEDYPYVDPAYPFTSHGEDNQFDLDRALTTSPAERLQPRLQPLTAQDLAAKIESIRAYASQMEILFGDPQPMAQQVDRYAHQVGQDRPAERVWVPV